MLCYHYYGNLYVSLRLAIFVKPYFVSVSDDCFTMNVGKIGLGEGLQIQVVSDYHCKLMCIKNPQCVGFDFDIDEYQCTLYGQGDNMNTTKNKCCIHTIRNTCYGKS